MVICTRAAKWWWKKLIDPYVLDCIWDGAEILIWEESSRIRIVIK